MADSTRSPSHSSSSQGTPATREALFAQRAAERKAHRTGRPSKHSRAPSANAGIQLRERLEPAAKPSSPRIFMDDWHRANVQRPMFVRGRITWIVPDQKTSPCLKVHFYLLLLLPLLLFFFFFFFVFFSLSAPIGKVPPHWNRIKHGGFIRLCSMT